MPIVLQENSHTGTTARVPISKMLCCCWMKWPNVNYSFAGPFFKFIFTAHSVRDPHVLGTAPCGNKYRLSSTYFLSLCDSLFGYLLFLSIGLEPTATLCLYIHSSNSSFSIVQYKINSFHSFGVKNYIKSIIRLHMRGTLHDRRWATPLAHYHYRGERLTRDVYRQFFFIEKHVGGWLQVRRFKAKAKETENATPKLSGFDILFVFYVSVWLINCRCFCGFISTTFLIWTTN